MSRNVNSRFALNPSLNIGRSKFSRHSEVKLSGNVGRLIPFFVDEVLPGDTAEIKTNKVIRLQTPVTPFMDNLYADFYYFFVPNRLVWEHWKELMGENTSGPWAPTIEREMPQVTAPEGGWNIDTLADYMGIPVGVSGLSVSALPFRAYALIVNEWFRAQQVQDPVNIPVGDATTAGSNGDNYITDLVKGGQPFIATKFADYFTSGLPAPQRGPAVSIPLTDDGNFPVMSLSSEITVPPGGLAPLRWRTTGGANINTNPVEGYYYNGIGISNAPNYTYSLRESPNLGSDSITPSNLWAINNGQVVGASIDSLRQAYSIQRMLETDARGGGRYTEILRSHFSVISPDSRLQRPEYLGGNRLPITVSQVIQQSATDEVTPQGNVAAMSLTTDSHHDFKHSFTEHGWLIGLMVLRYDHTYQQGIERMWMRKDRYDFYWPELANLGEQEIRNSEIFAQGTAADDEVFAYQERYAEYRYKPSRVCGEMRSAAPQSLDSWHFADDYSTLPVLSSDWISEDKNNVDRVLAVQSTVSDQFFADLYVQLWHTRPMPVFSIPGLTGHF